MDSMIYNKMLHTPICTGKPWEAARNRPAEGTEESSALKEESQVTFSRHAVERVMERSVDVSSDKLERLNEGVKLAGEKGLKAPLILMDSTAFVVNVKNNRVVTVVNEESLKGTVFTNIDGTVMV